MFPVIPLRVNGFLKNYHRYVWYQYGIYLEENRMVDPFQYETIGINKLK